MTQNERQCPNCSNIIVYKSIYELRRADKINSVCNKCKHIKFGALNQEKKLTPKQVEELVALAKTGVNYDLLVEKFSRSKSVLSLILRKNGVEKKHIKKIAEQVSDNEWRCTKCGLVKAAEAFKATRCLGKLSYCRSCNQIQNVNSLNALPIRIFRERAKNIKRRSVLNNIPFDLDGEYLLKLFEQQEGKCFYTHEPMSIAKGIGTQRTTASLDKLIPEKGYVKGNVVYCLQIINLAKTDMTLEELHKWIPNWHRKIQEKLNGN